MKHKIYLTGLLWLAGFAGSAQDTLHFGDYREFPDYVTHIFKDNHPDLTFLKYRVFTPQYNIFDYYKGNPDDSVCTPLKYLSLVNDLSVSNYDQSPKVNLPYIQRQLFNYVSQGITPISLSFIEYSEFKDSTVFMNCVGFNNNQYTEGCPSGYNPFKKNRLFAASALNEVHDNATINFLFNDSLLLSNIGGLIDSLYIDFDDGKGFVPLIKGSVYPIGYDTDGSKTLKLRMKADTAFYNASFSIVVSAGGAQRTSSVNSVSSCSTSPDVPDLLRIISVPNGSGPPITGKYGVWFSTCNSNSKIRKPYIISAGFNPGNGKQLLSNGLPSFVNFVLNLVTINIPLGGFGGDWRGTYYETYNGGWGKRFSITEANQCGEGSDNGDKYLDRLRDEGYDVIILSYDNGTDFIENNARLFKKLISDINAEKFNNGYFFENVVSGYSAGALSTRLALSQMEADYRQGTGPHPHTRMWVSFEGENQGANVPLGFQHLLDYQSSSGHLLPPLWTLNPLANMADMVNLTAANIADGFNNSPTAREVNKYTSAFPVTAPTPERQGLLNALAAIPGNNSNGYPEFCRRVGVGQGSGKGTNIPHSYNYIFDAELGINAGSGTAVSIPSTCGGSYTWYMPGTGKRTTARWWNSSNSNVFDGYTFLDSRFTIFPMTCVKMPWYLGGGCYCMGPYNIGSYTTYGNVSVATPNSVTTNWDNVPASLLSSHLELYGVVNGGGSTSSAYPFYNSWFAGNASLCNIDPNLHGLAPTVSTLDLHDPNTGQPANNFTSPVSLNLMNIKPLSGPSPQEPNLRYGFPFLAYPGNRYSCTPYDAVYAIGNNNGVDVNSNPRPDNQLHVEDPQVFIGNYLSRIEVAPTDLYMSNRSVGSTLNAPCTSPGCYTAEFEARNTITVGNGIYAPNGNYLTPDGDFAITNNTRAIMHTGDVISLLPGTSVVAGSELNAYIQGYNCSNNLFRNPHAGLAGGSRNGAVSAGEQAWYAQNTTSSKTVKVYPNPSSGQLSIERDSEEESGISISDLTGKVVYESALKTERVKTIDLSSLQSGIYLLAVGGERFKIIISK